ncbi:sulfite exporter TauE/SafE family protein [Dactylosporangium aurantiacum]|uniref:Probable membrane transporter protein n=1 Tax=Dactylosporangium aurantiacum TaxID=35754 RepID=A0A9Q9ILJ8_9ACTN|nr:sulfite exporter TauE/SafE family protein [Dactylosporangium aurantiacum]MDG6105939.1 sulfite exporter TauE/SafE family protein [Dactylosporangium aurantiacum]UWZ57891.1 sulfite exporter TauE/SafE family protein [Dactylosporangium aurantiacum]
MTALIVTVVLAGAIGVSLGLLGGGGSILAVPLLVYVAGLPAKEAIATSLLVVGATSAVAVVPHLRAGRVRWRTGLIFGLAGMTGAYTGGRLAAYIPAGVLLTGFAVMMLATATAMIRGRRGTGGEPAPRELPLPRVVADGVVVGLVTGLVGAGGGFLVVPALALLGGLSMPVAVGTSLVVIAMKSFAGFAGYLSGVSVDWTLAAAVTIAAAAGSLIGARLAGRVPAEVLRKTFGWFVVAMGTFVLAQQLPGGLRGDPAFLAACGATAVVVVAASVVRRRTRRARPPGRPELQGVPGRRTVQETREAAL